MSRYLILLIILLGLAGAGGVGYILIKKPVVPSPSVTKDQVTFEGAVSDRESAEGGNGQKPSTAPPTGTNVQTKTVPPSSSTPPPSTVSSADKAAASAQINKLNTTSSEYQKMNNSAGQLNENTDL